MQGKWIGCAYYRHRPFRMDRVCLFCNPDISPETLGAILANQDRLEYYQALHQGKECHARKCERAGQYSDELSEGAHWWCREHLHQCLFLRAGAARGWPAWEGLGAGRPAWYARMMSANPVYLAAMLANLVDAQSYQELEAYVEEYASNALGQRESVVTR